MTPSIGSNIDVVVYALARLGGATRKVPTELIAHESFALAPDRFSWILEQFRNLPDKYVTKTALEDAAKPKYGARVAGRYAREESRDGWVLTPAGVRWLHSNTPRIEASLALPPDKAPRLPPVDVRRLRSRLDRDPVFAKYAASGTLVGVTRYMLADLLQASPDAPSDLLRSKLDRLISTAELAREAEIIKFFHAIEQHFAHVLRPQRDSPHE